MRSSHRLSHTVVYSTNPSYQNPNQRTAHSPLPSALCRLLSEQGPQSPVWKRPPTPASARWSPAFRLKIKQPGEAIIPAKMSFWSFWSFRSLRSLPKNCPTPYYHVFILHSSRRFPVLISNTRTHVRCNMPALLSQAVTPELLKNRAG